MPKRTSSAPSIVFTNRLYSSSPEYVRTVLLEWIDRIATEPSFKWPSHQEILVEVSFKVSTPSQGKPLIHVLAP